MKMVLIGFMLIVASCKTTTKETILEPEKKPVEVKKEVKPTIKEIKTKQDSDDDLYKTTTCLLDNDERKIATVPQDPSGCRVSYTKFNESQIIGAAVNEISICDTVHNKVKINLEKAGFKCE